MAQLWKYDTIVGGWHFEDGLDYKGDNDINLIGTTTVLGKLDDAQSFVANDFGVSDGLITSLASVTKGTIAGWVFLDSDTGGTEYIMSCSKSNGSGATRQKLYIRAEWGVNKALDIVAMINGTIQFNVRTPVNSLTPFIGSWVPYEIEHDETKVSRIELNGIDQVITRATTLDESVWFSDIITAGADTFSWGSLQEVSRSGFLEGDLDESMINSELWDATDRAAFVNGGAGQIITEPPPPIEAEETPLFLRMYRHLLPNSKAWRI